jgi:hypothetical protein
MIGHGRVFEDFRSGRLNDDDEVAVIHGPAELDFAPLSDAMVDIRANIAEARAHGIMTDEEACRAINLAKSRFFKERHLSEAVQEGCGKAKAEAVLAWLADRRPGVKAADARGVLANLRQLQAPPVASKFIETIYLRRLEAFGFVPTIQ